MLHVGLVRDTHVDSLVAGDPVVFFASVGEDTNPTYRGKRKGDDASVSKADTRCKLV